MFVVPVSRVNLIVLLLAFRLLTANCPHIQAQNYSASSFSCASLLEQFDLDKSGTLDGEERKSLRHAFGDIDVPMLPDELTRTALEGRPTQLLTPHAAGEGHVKMMLAEADNTPESNPLTAAGVNLGRVLFYDKQLSRNDTVACSSCHLQQHGFADPRPFSTGFQGGLTKRNAMNLANLRYTHHKGAQPGFFWDERAPTLEAQVLMPIQDPVEMGMDLKQLEAKLQRIPYYPPLFEAAFGSREVTSEKLAKAISQFMRSMVTLNSKFDRAASKIADCNYSAPFADFTDQENQGKSLFINGVGNVAEFGCAFCHMPPTFNMPKSFNNGLDLIHKDRGLGELNRPANDPFTPSNDGKFKAPSLRNIAVSAPYMHDGRFKTLEEVVEHYSSRVQRHENLGLAFNDQDSDKATMGFQFSADQKAALVAFLKTLTDEEFLSNPHFADPFIHCDSGSVVANCAEQDPSAADQYQKLIDEYEKGAEAVDLVDRFFQLAENHPKDSAAVDALVWIVTKLRSKPEAIRAIELLGRDHLENKRLGAACPQIARLPNVAAEKLLRQIVDKSPHREVRAQACHGLATLLDQQGTLVDQLQRQPESANRVLQYYGKEYGEHLRKLTRRDLDREREKVYQQMLDSYADISTRDGVLLMGDIARKSLFMIRHLSVGQRAPEIEGEDIAGVKFRLSDYRGKIVMLSFWGHW
jgi:cytochrome c peroxidase